MYRTRRRFFERGGAQHDTHTWETIARHPDTTVGVTIIAMKPQSCTYVLVIARLAFEMRLVRSVRSARLVRSLR